MRLLGIDPGSVSAAWALLDTMTGVALVGDVPVVDRQVDGAGFAQLLPVLEPDAAIIELVASRPGQGIASTAKFMLGTGIIRGVIAACGIPLHQVTPTKWKKAFALDSDKEKSRALALRLYPQLADQLSRKKDAGRAEALLLARFLAERLK